MRNHRTFLFILLQQYNKVQSSMKTKYLLGMLMLFLFTFSFISCDKDDLTDKVETIRMHVSAETDTYTPWGSDTPVECMLVKEEGSANFSKLPFNGIDGFVYKKGYEFTLNVEKTTLANPPADASNVRYKLIEIITEQEK